MDAVELSLPDARRIALRAQGFGGPRSGTNGNLRAVRKVVRTLHYLQMDAVNVLIRAHYLPVFSRVGAYDIGHLDRMAYKRRELFEHRPKGALGLFDVDLHRLFRWSLTPRYEKMWEHALERVEAARPGYVDMVIAEITERGPLAYTELSDPGRIPKDQRRTKYAASSVMWSSWSLGDSVINALAHGGRLMVAKRKGFEPQYDLTERVIPAEVLARPTPDPEDAQRELVRLSARAVGVGTAKDIAGYFRLPATITRARVADLLATDELRNVRVAGWKDRAYLAAEAVAAPVKGQALLSPFDSLLWERKRVRNLFDFEHVFELYVPAAKRRYGYYVLPFLLDEAIAARVDLKADRSRGALVVGGAYLEPGQSPKSVTDALGGELEAMAAWLSLDAIEVDERGDLAAPLRRRLRRRR